MTLNIACEKAIERFLHSGLDYGIVTLAQTSKDWYFIGGFEDENVVNYCAYVLKIKKKTGEQTDMSLSPDNDEELMSVELMNIPEKYRIKYKK